jgi:hypothetical protein
MFKHATKEQSKLRLAIFAPAGAGKTYTALRVATGIGGKIAVIDSERGSASKYADRFTFDVVNLDNFTIEEYTKWINEASKLGYDVLVIDSMTHCWQSLLEEVDQLARTRFGGNSFQAWSIGTPKQRKFVDAIQAYTGHIIATMRVKTEWNMIEDERGRKKPVRIGLTPEQGKGIEYEFDMLIEINPEHVATVIKDRTGKFQDQIIDKPSEELGKQLKAWLAEGATPPAKQEQPKAEAPKAEPVKATKQELLKLIADVKDRTALTKLYRQHKATIDADNDLMAKLKEMSTKYPEKK